MNSKGINKIHLIMHTNFNFSLNVYILYVETLESKIRNERTKIPKQREYFPNEFSSHCASFCIANSLQSNLDEISQTYLFQRKLILLTNITNQRSAKYQFDRSKPHINTTRTKAHLYQLHTIREHNNLSRTSATFSRPTLASK